MTEKWKGIKKTEDKSSRWGNRLFPSKWLPVPYIDDENKSTKFQDKDIHNVEIGDTKDPSHFYPQAKIMQWGNETNFSLRLETDYDGCEYTLEDIDNLKWVSSDKNTEVKIFQFDKPDKSLRLEDKHAENGGLEFEIILKKKPSSNEIKYSYTSKNLRFYYQPEISDEVAQEELDKLHSIDSTAYTDWTLEDVKRKMRPEKVVGSYAAYHVSKKDDEYRTGKAFHIYRPHVVDRAGNFTYADLRIGRGYVYITIPQEFLDNALYPILIDPTVGYTTIGGSTLTLADNNATATKGNAGAIAGATNYYVDSVTTYVSVGKKNGTLKAVIWNYSDDTIVTNGVGNTVVLNNDGWFTATYSTEPLLAESTDYWIGGVYDVGNIDVHYDAGSAGDGHFHATNSFATPVALAGTDQARLYSHYLTYTTTSSSSSSSSRSSSSSSSSSSSLSSSSSSSSSYSCAEIDLIQPHYWDPTIGTWDASNQEWDSNTAGPYYVDLRAKDPWFDGFRPDFIDLTYSGPTPVAFELRDQDSPVNVIASGFLSVGANRFSITFQGFDIETFVVTTPVGTFSITDLSFCGGTLGSSSSSSSRSSSSSSSSSAAPGTVVWGHHTGVSETYDEDFFTNWSTDNGWTISGSPGSDNEALDATASCDAISISDPWYLGTMTAVIRVDKYQTGYGPSPVIHYKTAATGAGLSAASWTLYNGVSFVSLGWIQLRVTHV